MSKSSGRGKSTKGHRSSGDPSPKKPSPEKLSPTGDTELTPHAAGAKQSSVALVAQNDAKPSFNVSKMASFVVLLLVIVVIGVLSIRVIQGFLLPLFLAALVVVIFRPVHVWMLKRFRNRKRIAAALTTMVVLLTVLAPFAWGIKTAVQEGVVISTGHWDLEARLDKIRSKFGLQLPHRELLDQIEAQLIEVTPPYDSQVAWKVSQNTTNALTTLDSALAELDNVVDVPEDSELQACLLAARDSTAEARDETHKILKNGSTVVEIRAYDKAITRLNVQYHKFRELLCGAFPRAAIVELVNPSEPELEMWQAKARAYLQEWLLSVSGKSTAVLAQLLLGIAIMLISIFYFLIDGPEMIKAGMRLSPLDDKYEEQLVQEFGKVSRAVVLATLLSAIVQGLLAGIGYFFAGIGPVFLLTVLTMMLALVPFVGAAAVWVPTALCLAFVDDNIMAGISLAIYGAVIVSMADNVIKPLILHGQSNLHPLMALLSVLGGVKALGAIGILIGPMLLAFLQVLLDMLRRELQSISTT